MYLIIVSMRELIFTFFYRKFDFSTELELGESRNTTNDVQTWFKHVAMNATVSDSTSIGAERFSIKVFDHRTGSPIGRLRWVILDEVRKQSSIVHNAKGIIITKVVAKVKHMLLSAETFN